MPEIGNYVVCNYAGVILVLKSFINNNIGILIDIKNNQPPMNQNQINANLRPVGLTTLYKIKFNDEINLTGYTNSGIWWFNKNEILFYSNNEKDCKAFIDANKYNL